MSVKNFFDIESIHIVSNAELEEAIQHGVLAEYTYEGETVSVAEYNGHIYVIDIKGEPHES